MVVMMVVSGGGSVGICCGVSGCGGGCIIAL